MCQGEKSISMCLFFILHSSLDGGWGYFCITFPSQSRSHLSLSLPWKTEECVWININELPFPFTHHWRLHTADFLISAFASIAQWLSHPEIRLSCVKNFSSSYLLSKVWEASVEICLVRGIRSDFVLASYTLPLCCWWRCSLTVPEALQYSRKLSSQNRLIKTQSSCFIGFQLIFFRNGCLNGRSNGHRLSSKGS